MSLPQKYFPFLLVALLFLFWMAFPPPGRGEDCLTAGCHPKLDSLKNLHPPFAGGECEACHSRLQGAHPAKGPAPFELSAKGAELCTQCHDSLGKGKFAHAPAEEGECLACHNPHGSSAPFMLRTKGGTSSLCLECHDGASFKQKFLHGPVAAGDCTVCHDPHRAPEKALLRKPVRDLCISCHSAFKQLEKAAVTHPPVREEACTVCHNPHSAPTQNLLATSQPAVCLNCHPKIGEKMEKAKTKHAPLHGQESCGGCHSSHYSEHRGLLPSAQGSLCLSCHGKDGTSKVLRNISRELEKKKFVHSPVKEGKCAACHDPHGTDSSRLLNGPYPTDFYAPYQQGSYDFCLKCHEKDLLRFADTTIYTQFRNGKQNLHYVHVAGKRKGRSCRACHEPHASNTEKLISDGGPAFGEWKIPVRFKITSTGGSCAPGCHRELAYDRDKPVDYSSSPKPSSPNPSSPNPSSPKPAASSKPALASQSN